MKFFKFEKFNITWKVQTPAKAADRAKFVKLVPSRNGKNFLNPSRSRIRINNKSNNFLPVRPPTPRKNFARICRQLLELSAEFVILLPSHNGKNSFKKFRVPEPDSDDFQNNLLGGGSNPNWFLSNNESLSCLQRVHLQMFVRL